MKTRTNPDKDFVMTHFPKAKFKVSYSDIRDYKTGKVVGRDTHYQVIIHDTGYNVYTSKYVAAGSTEARAWKSARTKANNLLIDSKNEVKTLKNGKKRYSKTQVAVRIRELHETFPIGSIWKYDGTIIKVTGVSLCHIGGKYEEPSLRSDDHTVYYHRLDQLKEVTKEEYVLWKLENA